LRKPLLILIGILLFGFSLFQISLWSQNRNFIKFGTEFNAQRIKIGLNQIPENWSSEKKTWDDWQDLSENYILDNQIQKYIEIFSLKDIRTAISYKNDSINKNELYQIKVSWMNSNLLFWRNKISSERDVYIRTTDSVTEENLVIRYYFKDDNGNKDYFEASYYQFNENDFGFCGTPQIMEREQQRLSGKPYFGNITKKQADSILTNWLENN
jgi:hypothetical protein